MITIQRRGRTSLSPKRTDREAMDDLDLLLAALPPEIVEAVHALPEKDTLIEVVLDLGRRPEARFPNSEVTLLDREIGEADIAYVVEHIGTFGDDNRAGIERTLHRISAIRNRSGKIVGLTCRIGRAVYGTIEIIKDFVETGKSILIMGRPGIGKTTMLREAARVLADDLGKRVVVVDTSNEIAGDGDIPHPAIGKARRMQVRTPSLQHEVMIEAVENHMPQVIVIDEIGTELEAQAARTIAERGVQLIGTAHGNNLDNLMLNPTLSDLIGGIQSVTLGDEEARRRRTQKSVLERKAPPTFDVIVEIQDRERVMVHSDVADTVDAMLRGDPVAPELRWRDEEGVHRSQARPRPSPREQLGTERFAGLVGSGSPWRMEPGWRGDGGYRGGGYRDGGPGGTGPAAATGTGAGYRSGYRPGQSGGWRQTRGGTTRESGPRGRIADPGAPEGAPGMLPGERFAVPPGGAGPRGRSGPPLVADAPFVSGEIADRGPLERSAPAAPEPRARDARELERQEAWRRQAARAIEDLKVEEGTAPVNLDDLAAGGPERTTSMATTRRWRTSPASERPSTTMAPSCGSRAPAGCPTLRVLPHGVSRKRLEQAVRELQLPVVVARDVDEAGRRHDPPQRVPPEDADAPRGGGARDADLRPQEQHDPPDAGEPHLDLLARGGSAGSRPARDRGGDRTGHAPGGAGGAQPPERVHPATPAPDGRAGQPRVPIPRSRAVPPGPAVPRSGPRRLALDADRCSPRLRSTVPVPRRPSSHRRRRAV